MCPQELFVRRPRLSASWLLLPSGVALCCPKCKLVAERSPGEQACGLLAPGTVFTVVPPFLSPLTGLLSPGSLPPSPQGESSGKVCRPQPRCPNSGSNPASACFSLCGLGQNTALHWKAGEAWVMCGQGSAHTWYRRRRRMCIGSFPLRWPGWCEGLC